MTRTISAILAGTVAVGTALTSFGPAAAAPLNIPAPQAAETTDNVMNVQNRRGFYHQGNRYYYNGHRGYRERRPGWRQHNGWWFPPAAFALGAIVGGAIANQPPVYRPPVYREPVRLSNAHVRWCENRWRSYRAWDNSYQPNRGPRQQCVSPYSR